MAPVCANETDGAIVGEGFDLGERRGQQLRELRIGHFTGCHRKLTMFDATTTVRMTLDRRVVGRIPCRPDRAPTASDRMRSSAPTRSRGGVVRAAKDLQAWKPSERRA